MMQHNRELRTLADIATFGDGAKLFSAPQVDGIEGAVSDLYTTTVGTLYRARLWVRADKFYLQTGKINLHIHAQPVQVKKAHKTQN